MRLMRLIKLFLFSLIPALTPVLVAQVHTEKTFLLPQLIRVPAQNIFYDLVTNLSDQTDALGWDHFQVTSLYREENNGTDIGRYFGRNGQNAISIGKGETDFQSVNLVFNQNPDNVDLAGTLVLDPHRKIKGFHISYLKRLTLFSDRLFFNVHTPIVRVTSLIRPKVVDEVEQRIEGNRVGVLDYFSGKLEQKLAMTKQDPLKYAKIAKNGRLGRVGLADVECTLGYEFGNGYYFRPFIGAVIPTSNRPNGEYLFEPVLGSASQWGASVGVEGMTIAYESDDTVIDLAASGQLKYFFSNRQKRTVGFMSSDWSSKRVWGHYELFGEQDKLGVFPGANVLTRDVDVQQGVLLDCNIGCNFRHRRCMINFGYNYFSRARESVKVRHWDDNRYALASVVYQGDAPFDIDSDVDQLTSDNLDGPITKEMLDTSVAETPALVSHKLYGMVSYVRSSLPISFGVGGSYEFAQGNAPLQGYELFARVNVSF